MLAPRDIVVAISRHQHARMNPPRQGITLVVMDRLGLRDYSGDRGYVPTAATPLDSHALRAVNSFYDGDI